MARKLCEKRGDIQSLHNWKNIKAIKEGSDRGDPVLQLYAFLYGLDMISSIAV